jgi:hypothetical protein
MSYTYLREQGEESSADSFSAIPASVLLSGMPTRGAFYSLDSGTGHYRGSQSGMMSRRLTARRGAGAWMLLRAAFRVRTYRRLERAQALTGNGRECGDTWPASLARYDRDSRSWKTPQFSLFGGSESFSATWPRWGMMRSGVCWELPTPGRHTNENASGFLLPTPTAQDAKNNGAPSQMERNTKPLNAEIGGALNPTWVEWLMGWPLGWTDCDVSATDKYRQWRRSHGKR